jgi:hypothetical protein
MKITPPTSISSRACGSFLSGKRKSAHNAIRPDRRMPHHKKHSWNSNFQENPWCARSGTSSGPSSMSRATARQLPPTKCPRTSPRCRCCRSGATTARVRPGRTATNAATAAWRQRTRSGCRWFRQVAAAQGLPQGQANLLIGWLGVRSRRVVALF